MKNILLSIAAWIGMAFVCSLSAQNIKPDKIEDIKVQASDMPSGFDLHLERLSKPGSSLDTQVNQYWEQGFVTPDLKLVNEEIP